MARELNLSAGRPKARAARPIKVAITALGGQGGGVLTQWIVDLAEANGYSAQSTSVPGVAQRTGATLYYVEMFPLQAANRAPVFALMPLPGDVDVVAAAELMEAGRAMLRGIVTADRTTLITSAHREYAIAERTAMGDGIADPKAVLEAGERSAKRFIAFDMATLAADTESVISAVLFGALAGSGSLPFARSAFEETVRATGRSVESNLAGFAAGYENARTPPSLAEAPSPRAADPIGNATTAQGGALLERVRAAFPEDTHEVIAHGVRRLVDYQSFAYAAQYLDRLAPILSAEIAQGAKVGHPLTVEAARYLALWMSFEDTIRVADLKTRSTRFERVRREVRAKDDQLVYMSEYMSPRPQEICELMWAPLGRTMLKSRAASGALGLVFNKGRRIHTAKLHGFLMLYALGGLRWWRPATLKSCEEQARITAWLDRVTRAIASGDVAFAGEIIECQRLVKGYSETFERGLRNYAKIMAIADPLIGADRPSDAQKAERVRRLRGAALADERGETLDREMAALAA